MKTKNFNKKLVLKKTTVADLRKDEMNAANGGATSGCVTQKAPCWTYVPRDSVCLICTGYC
jgi:hypothetical protein